MLQGQLVRLRARTAADVPVLHSRLHDDVTTFSLAHSRPWRPYPADPATSPYAPRTEQADSAPFSVDELATGELAGVATLWGIDSHNRNADIGLTLLPACRGRGLGTDVVRVLCHYGFTILGLHRLQIETAVDNAGMLGAARGAGFTVEGTRREAFWTAGRFVDDVTLGLLAPPPAP